MSTKTTPRLGYPQDENIISIATSRLSKPYNNDQKFQNLRARHHQIGPLFISCIGSPLTTSTTQEDQQQQQQQQASGFLPIKGIPDEVVQISSGENHVGFLTKTSRLYMMGDNTFNQLGFDSVATPKLPSLQTFLINVEIAQISCGAEHTFVLTTRGEVYAWGLNLKGQLGLGHNEKVERPTPVQALLPWNKLNGKHKRNLSLITLSHSKNIQIPSSSKTPYKQRSNSIDISDNEGQPDKAIATALDSDERVLEVACGALHTLVRTDSHKILSCGYGATHALGHGDKNSHNEFRQVISLANCRTSRATASSGEEIERICAGISHSGCIKGGKAYVWGVCGSKESQNLGLPSQVEIKQGHLNNLSSETIVDMQLGDLLSVFLTQKGEVYTMGDNMYGQLGTLDENGSTPQKVELPGPIAYISTGRNQVIALTEYNQLYGWGLNDHCQLGILTEEKMFKTPVCLQQFVELDTVQVFSGNSRTFFLSGKPTTEDGFGILRPLNMENKQQLQQQQQELLKTSQENEALKKSVEELKNRMKKMSKENERLQAELAKQQTIMMYKASKSNAVTQTDAEMVDKMETKVSQRRKKTSRSLSLDIIENPQKMLTPQFEIDFKELVLEKQISEGGYGLIFRGKWRESTVAIKMLKAENMKEENINDFLRECQSMHCLRHPNIVMFLGACTKPPNFAIVLEFCPRGSLWSFLQNLDINLTWEDRKRFALDTAKAMNYLHCFNPAVLHRDLKSLNLLLDDSFRVKLADFGWTRTKDALMTAKIGTYQWMAPEVIMGQQYTEKADIYSFGIILWEMASREPPFRHLSGVQVSLEVVNNDLRPPIPKKTPENWVRIMKRCWDRDPNKRPSFKELIKELEGMKFN